MKRIFAKLYIPVGWTIFIEILLCLPGKALPDAARFKIPFIDKIAHTVIFGGFVALWCLYFSNKVKNFNKLTLAFFCVYLVACFNGIVIEYIQLYFIPNRSFELSDIISDILSAGIVYGLCNVKLLTPRVEKLPQQTGAIPV